MSTKVLEVLEGVLCVLQLFEGVRRVLEAVEICWIICCKYGR